MVGNMDSTPQSATVERKVSSSSTGPGVNIYAAGTDIQVHLALPMFILMRHTGVTVLLDKEQ